MIIIPPNQKGGIRNIDRKTQLMANFIIQFKESGVATIHKNRYGWSGDMTVAEGIELINKEFKKAILHGNSNP